MLDPDQKRTLVALACKVAWADGVIVENERVEIKALLDRLGGAPVTDAELDAWLTTGAPEVELASLPEPIREMFVYDAMKLAQADGNLTTREVDLIQSLMDRVAELRHGVTLGKIARPKR